MIRILIILLFIGGTASAQTKVAFGGTRPIDTAWAARFLRIDSALRLLKYSTADSNKVLGFDANGNGILRTKGTGGGGGSTDTTALSNRINEKQNFTDTATYDATKAWVLSQSFGTPYYAGNRIGLNTDSFYLDTASLFAYNFTSPNNFTLPTTAAVNSELGNYVSAVRLNDSMVVVRDSLADHWTAIMSKVNYSDTTTIIATKANVNTKQNFSDTTTFDATRSWVGLQIPSLTGYVPYTGATADVNLGAYNLITSLVKTDTVQANSSMGVHIHGTGGKGIMVGAGGGGTITFDDYTTTVAGDSVLTTNSAGGLLRYNLKGKLANYQLYSDTTTFDATRAWVNGRGFGTGTVTSVGVVAGTGVSIGGTSPITSAGTYTITNTAPDQTVTITASTNITVTGSYPTFTISATGGGGGVAKLKAVAPVTLTAGTGDTVIISISPNTTYTITEATQFGYSGANGLIQKITMTNAQDTVTVDTATLVEGVTYELRVIQGAGGNKILHWANTGTLFQGGTTATGRPYQDIGAAEISRYFIQKSDANLYVNPVINNRN
jgi:hypothetical protein